MTQYRTIARFSIQGVIVVFFAVFTFVAYHRLMPMTMPMDVSASPASCEVICLLGAALNWQQTTESVYALRVVGSGIAIFLSLLVLVFQLKSSLIDSILDKLVKLKLYYKYRWRLLWISYWSQIYQRGIIPPRLYA